MRKLLLLLTLSVIYVTATAQQKYPTLDSLRGGVNKYIKTSPIDAFQGYRLNGIMNSVVDYLSGAGAGGGAIDTAYGVTDSTFRVRKNGNLYTVTVKGVYDSRRKVDSIYAFNDSTLKVVINGVAQNVIVKGTGASTGIFAPNALKYNSNPNIGDLCDSCPATKKNLEDEIAAATIGVFKDATILGDNTTGNPLGVDTTIIATKTDFGKSKDSIGRTPGVDSFNIYRNGSLLYKVKDSVGAPGGGDGIGSVGVLHNNTLTGTGKVSDSLKVDSSVIATRSWVNNLPGITPPDGTETKVNIGGVGLSITGNGSTASPYVLTNTGSPGTNPMNAYVLTGLVSDVVIPGSGSTVTGTNNTPVLQAAINAAADGQIIIVPHGNYLFSTPLDTIQGPKTVHLLILGNTYHNGSDFIILGNASGATENESIIHLGEAWGRVNSPSHTQTTHDNGTGPQWNTYTGTPFKVYNSNEHYIKFNKVMGFKNAFEVIGNDYDGANRGSQEITIEGREIKDCANGAVLTSLNGRSYCDKIYVRGWGGAKMVFRGGLGIKVDGYAGAAFNGENYNGAFQSDEFHMMIERCDSIAEILGEAREPLFDVTVEGSAVHGAVGWKVRSVSPNYVRDPRYMGGFMEYTWIQNGLGINARGFNPIWNSAAGRRFTNEWKTDGSGNLVLIGSTLSKTQRDASPSTFLYAPGNEPVVYKTITASTYSILPGEVIQVNNASATITAPAASGYVGRRFTIQNIHATSAVVVSAVANYTSIPAGDNMTWESNGTDWRGIVNAEGTGGGGTSPWTNDANGITYSGNIGVRVASKTGAAIAAPAGTTTIAPLNIAPGVRKTTPNNGDEQNDGDYRLVTLNGITYRYMLVPDNGGLAGQVAKVNAAGTGYEFDYPNYALAYSQTSAVLVTNTTETSIIGGSKTITNADLSVGDKVIVKGGGFVGNGSIHFKFTCGTKVVIIVPTAAATLPTTAGEEDTNKDYEYTMEYTATATGTSAAGFLKITVRLEGETPVMFNEAVASGLNSVSPVINVAYKNNGGTNACTSLNNTIEIVRQ